MSDSVTCQSLVNALIEIAKERDPLFEERKLAARVGIDPAVLSRMKRQSSCNIPILDAMARTVGLRLGFVPDDEALRKIEEGTYFDE